MKMTMLVMATCLSVLVMLSGGCAMVETCRFSFPSADGMTRPPIGEMPPGIRHEPAYHADRSRLNLICHAPGLDMFISPRNDVTVHATLWMLILPVWGWDEQGSGGGTNYIVQVNLRPRESGFVIRPNEITLLVTNSLVRPTGYYGPWPTEREQKALQADVSALWADMSFADKLGLTRSAARKRRLVDEADARYRGVDRWRIPHRETADSVILADTNAWYRLYLEFKGAGPTPDQLRGIRIEGVSKDGRPCPVPEIPFRAVRYTRTQGIP